MLKNRLLLVVLVLFSASSEAQSFFSKKIEGRVFSKDGDVAATHVQNLSTKRATITDIDGFFSIYANLNDTLLFSAVQYKKKHLVITADMLKQKILRVLLDDALNVLDEVTVTPYNLSGDIAKDLQVIRTDAVVTSQTVGLPNAYARVPSKAERELFEATTGGGILPLNPILNAISGRTKMLKKRVARNDLYARTLRVKEFYADSLFTSELNIPKDKIDDLLYFCEVDNDFQKVVDSHDRFKIWEFIRKKSVLYLENNKSP
jgi:hypothetical protein